MSWKSKLPIGTALAATVMALNVGPASDAGLRRGRHA